MTDETVISMLRSAMVSMNDAMAKAADNDILVDIDQIDVTEMQHAVTARQINIHVTKMNVEFDRFL